MKQSIFYLFIVIATILTITSCSKKPIKLLESDPPVQEIYFGGIYNGCDPNFHIFMNIDSLKKYCNRNNRLNDLLVEDSNFPSSLNCQNPNNEFNYLIINEENWDFKISITNGYQVEWRETPLSIQPIEVETGFRQPGKYPFAHFYKGYEFQISEDQTLTVLFFNEWVGGCIHDVYVWELVEN